MGKGSGRRPMKVDKEKASDNWDRIFGERNNYDALDVEAELKEAKELDNVDVS